MPRHRQLLQHSAWPHRFAVVTAAATLLLIFVGGLVTNTGSALAVPDWPTTFGYNMFLYPWSQWVGGIFYEHSHRLIGSAVGMLTIACVVSVWLADSRRWLRRLGAAALVAVILQGVLGGLRVVLLESPLAIVHGCFAQAFLALMVALSVFTSSWWLTAERAQRPDHARALRRLALLTAPAVYVQIIFGALLTHTGTRLDAHLFFAGVSTVLIVLFAGGVLRGAGGDAELRRPALLLLVILPLQLSLGLGAFLRRYGLLNEVMSSAVGLALPATHRIVGALVLALTVVLGLRVLRVVGATQAAVARTGALETALSLAGGRGRGVTA